MRDVFAREGIQPRKVRYVLGTEVPSNISVSLRKGSDSLFLAACEDIEERLAATPRARSFAATQGSADYHWGVARSIVQMVTSAPAPAPEAPQFPSANRADTDNGSKGVDVELGSPTPAFDTFFPDAKTKGSKEVDDEEDQVVAAAAEEQ